MQAKRILEFLKQVSINNNREWFAAHRDEYDAVRADYEAGITKAIGRIATFDPQIAARFEPLGPYNVKDCCYRFNRDTRFSADKSPYKNHLGAYICEGGKKSLRGGYYIQLEWERCLVAFGCYWLPTPVLTACRTEIMQNISRWRDIVERPAFVELFGRAGEGYWHFGNSAANDYDNSISPRGFGMTAVKTCPKGFPRDFQYPEYLRMKEYVVWRTVPMDFFEGDAWLDAVEQWGRVAQPMLEFVNAVIRELGER